MLLHKLKSPLPLPLALSVAARSHYIITGKYAEHVRKTYPGAMWRNNKRTHAVKWHSQDPLYHN